MEDTENILVKCECGARLLAPPKLFGRTIKCPGCGADLTIPGEPVESSDKGSPPVEAQSDVAPDAAQMTPQAGPSTGHEAVEATRPMQAMAEQLATTAPMRVAVETPPEPTPGDARPVQAAKPERVEARRSEDAQAQLRPQARGSVSRVTLKERVTAEMPGASVSGPQVVASRDLLEREVRQPAPEPKPAVPMKTPGRAAWKACMVVWIVCIVLGLGHAVSLLLAGILWVPAQRERIAMFTFVELIGLALSALGAYVWWRRRQWVYGLAMAGFALAALWNLREVVAAAALIAAGEGAPSLAHSALPVHTPAWLWFALFSGALAFVLDVTFLSLAAGARGAFRARR